MTAAELSPAVKAAPGGSVISCHVQPNASKTAPAGMYGEAFKLALKTPPVDGRANLELCRFLADVFNVPGGSVRLIAGRTSRKKRVFVPVPPEIFLEKFSS